MTKATLGTIIEGGQPLDIDVERLISTRALIQANAGAGKSWAIRRLLEQTFGKVQHLVIDLEGEFHTLREKYPYVLARPQDGDCVAHPRSAALLARKLLELNASSTITRAGCQSFLGALTRASRKARTNAMRSWDFSS